MKNAPQKVIEVKNVRKIYRMGTEKIYAVDDVSFDICEGEFCCLLGTSGSGKSTLLNLMAGIEKLTSGQILIKGRPIHKMNETKLAKFRQKYLGFVFQSYNLIGTMTALENVELPLVFKRIPKRKRRIMAKEMLVKVGLKNRLHHKPKEMSGGQQQRVGIARAFVARPSIVFADEPTGNLDTKTTMEVMELIREIARANHQTIVMVTHDRRLAEFADRIIHVLDGKVQQIELVDREKKIAEQTREDIRKAVTEVLEEPVYEKAGAEEKEPAVEKESVMEQEPEPETLSEENTPVETEEITCENRAELEKEEISHEEEDNNTADNTVLTTSAD